MPTTDPGSDLIFSTDDEIADATNTIRYATLPQRIKRHLLSSQLQRRYEEEIGDCLRSMPPELVITAPSNKDKQKIPAQIYKPAAANISEANSQRTIVMMPSVRTRSWHNLKTSKRTLLPYKPVEAKNITQRPLCRPMSKKEVLNKEDLNIQLSLKKKIWAGIHQPDETSLSIDRTRALSWMEQHSLRDKNKTDEQTIYGDLNFCKHSICSSKKADNKAFISLYNKKLLEWQILSTNPNNSPYSQEGKKLDIKKDATIYAVKNVSNIKVASMEKHSKNKYDEVNNERKPKRKIKTKKILAKISKSRNNMITSHHCPSKQPLNQNKSHTQGYKLNTGGLVATAVQTGVRGDCSNAAKKNKKFKSVQNKLQDFNSYNTNSLKYAYPQIDLPHNNCNNNSKNKKNNLAMTTAATNIVQKAKKN